MKFLETSYEQYIKSVKDKNLHSKLEKYYSKMPDNLYELKNVILYGPSGIGKYSQALYMIEKYSPSKLKYQKKMHIHTSKESFYEFKISDIHYEIDFELLGCNSKFLWNDFYINTIDVISTKEHKSGIILCKNFHTIHNELLDIFYSYMQKSYSCLNVVFIIITDQVSFIPSCIYSCCKIINISTPSVSSFKTVFNNNPNDEIDNLKYYKTPLVEANSLINYYSEKVFQFITGNNFTNYNDLRVLLYNLLIFNLNIYSCMKYILYKLLEKDLLSVNQMSDIIFQTQIFFKYFNNNYRPIYHLENYILYLIIKVHEL
tara:strand:+ start:11004 stop:11951 length:948 start_codon:yes stop_codon:yes gene_type:complete